MFQQVGIFHFVFGHTIGNTPKLPELSIRNLRISLIREELDEFIEAYAVNDRIEMADALADLLYVLAGTSVAYGIAPNQVITSPYTCEPCYADHPVAYDALLVNAFERLLDCEIADFLPGIGVAIEQMMHMIFIIGRENRFPINALFTEVQRSNMSKLNPDGSVLRRDDGKILKGPNYSPPDIESVLRLHNAL